MSFKGPGNIMRTQPANRYASEPAQPVLAKFGVDGKLLPEFIPSVALDDAMVFSDMEEATGTDFASFGGKVAIIGGARGGVFFVDAAAEGTADGGIVIDVNGGAHQLVRQYEGPVRPEWWGAVGDGVTDDAAAFASSLAAGETVALTAGKTYLVAGITAYTGTDLNIEGSGATLKGDASTVFAKPQGAVRVRGVKFDTFASALRRVQADTGSISTASIEDCVFDSVSSIPLHFDVPVGAMTVRGCVFDGCGHRCIQVGENTYANQSTWTDIAISGNVFKDVDGGASDTAAILVYGEDVAITGNVIDGVASSSTETWGIYTKVRRGTITGNVLSNLTNSNGSGNIYAINIKGNNSTSTAAPQGFNITCSGNSCYSSESTLASAGIRSENEHVCITGNTVDGFLYGIVFSAGNDNHADLISNNVIRNSGSVGINVASQGDALSVTDNSIYESADAAIYVFGTGGAGLSVNGNLCVGCGHTSPTYPAIVIGPSTLATGVSVAGNVIEGCSNPTAIQIGKLQRFSVRGNVVDSGSLASAAGSVIDIQGYCPDGVIEGNRAYEGSHTGTGSSVLALFKTAGDGTYRITADFVGWDDANGNGASSTLTAVFKSDAGTVSQIGSTTTVFFASDVAITNPFFDTTGAGNIWIRARAGAASGATYKWHVNCRFESIGAS